MKKLNSKEIREIFVSYFQGKDHLKINASSIVPQNDPTLLFINSGMAPLKKYFLGKENPPCPRLVNFQPCIRTKDIDDVGDRHHLTMFEMLGSWSIGDYYKEKAVELAYGLLVHEMGFDPNRLYVTIYKGNDDIGLPADLESAAAWEAMGIHKDHIIHLGVDNFWGPAGDSGPCGPCTEVFFDCGEKFGPKWNPGDEFDTTKRYIEIWNAGVFMEFNKSKEGDFTSLPLKSVDTGSGLERMEMIMNGYDNVYQTDLLRPILELFRTHFPKLDETTLYMMTDHIRSSSMILAEGISPNKEGQGYIPRRLIRKILTALVSAGEKNIDLSFAVNKVVELMGEFYPILKQNKDFVLHQIQTETEDFLPIVRKGIEVIERILDSEKLTNDNQEKFIHNLGISTKDYEEFKKQRMFPAKTSFELATTHGMPVDVIKIELEKRKLKFDQDAFEKLDEEHRKVSRVVSYHTDGENSDSLEKLLEKTPATRFLGYDTLSHRGSVIDLIVSQKNVEVVKKSQEFIFTTHESPFYAESGGQSGDKGRIKGPRGEAIVRDTQKVGDIFIHLAKLTGGELSKKDTVLFEVDKETRLKTRRNHSATHLLHAALRTVVGKHALQKGSHVNSERLRFDFQNNTAVTDEELEKIEILVNHWIRDNNQGITRVLSYNEALKDGAIGLFGEAYGEKVRVVNFGPESKELCGGTHVESTGEIGLMVIVSESSVAKGVRRIEAVTGEKAVLYVQEHNRIIKQASRLLNSKASLVPENIQKLMDRKNEVKKQAPKDQVSLKSVEFTNENKIEIKGHSLIVARVDMDKDSLKTLGDQMMSQNKCDLLALYGIEEETIRSFVWVKEELSKKLKASDLLKELLAPISGKGGGKPHFAQGGSAEVGNIEKIQELSKSPKFKDWLNNKL